MNVPTSTIEDVKTVRFDKGKAYVPQEGEGQAFVERSQVPCYRTG